MNEEKTPNNFLVLCSCCACSAVIPLISSAAKQIIIMVFNGAEAFKGGASAPSLEREVSGK